MAAIIGSKSCRSCGYFLKFNGGLHCRRYPPTAFPVASQTPEGMQIRIHSSYPPINPDQPCGEYLRNEMLAREELLDATSGLHQ